MAKDEAKKDQTKVVPHAKELFDKLKKLRENTEHTIVSGLIEDQGSKWRIYTGPDLLEYLEVDKDQIEDFVDLDGFEKHVVIKKGAPVVHYVATPLKAQAGFLTGELTAAHLGAAANGPQATLMITPVTSTASNCCGGALGLTSTACQNCAGGYLTSTACQNCAGGFVTSTACQNCTGGHSFSTPVTVCRACQQVPGVSTAYTTFTSVSSPYPAGAIAAAPPVTSTPIVNYMNQFIPTTTCFASVLPPSIGCPQQEQPK
jgi:hypothetical protein